MRDWARSMNLVEISRYAQRVMWKPHCGGAPGATVATGCGVELPLFAGASADLTLTIVLAVANISLEPAAANASAVTVKSPALPNW